MSRWRVIGVHPVQASQPVHLLEIEVPDFISDIEWSDITQPVPDRDRSYWQVPYDERRVPDRSDRWCFFFHYLDRSRPLRSPAGELTLPAETPAPDYLRFIRYEEP